MSVQVINDKLQGSVATYLTCSGAVNNQIRKSLLLNLSVNFLIGEYLAKLRSLFSSFSSVLTRCAKCMRQQRSCLKLCQIFNDLKNHYSKFIKESCSDFFKSVKIWQNCGHESVRPHFVGPPCRPRHRRTAATSISAGKTRSSATAEERVSTLCQLKSCQLLQNCIRMPFK